MKIIYLVEPAQTEDPDEVVRYRCADCGAEVEDVDLPDHAMDVHNTIFFETDWDDVEIEEDPLDPNDDLFFSN